MAAKNDSAIEITEQEFQETVNNSHKLVVVDFFAEWCMPCVMLAPVIEDLAGQMKDVKFVKIKDGTEVDRVVGSRGGDEIEEWVRKFL
jgi:thioredoxin 1